MNIIIDDISYEVPAEMIESMLNDAWDTLADMYYKQDETLLLAAKLVSRHILGKMQIEVPELPEFIGMDIKPPKHEDPNIHLLRVMLKIIHEALVRYVTFTIGTTGVSDQGIALVAFSIEGEGQSGRQVAYSWDDRYGEIDVHEETALVDREAVSNVADIHP